MEIWSFTFNPFAENTYVIWDETREAAVVDPGCYTPEERAELTDFIAEKKLDVKLLLNTHAHIDHVLGNAFIKKKFGVALWLHRLEAPVLKSAEVFAGVYGIPAFESSTADYEIKENESIRFGNTALEVLFVPGHSPGHVAFYNRTTGILLAGDVLFNRSIGRTDLPGGDYDTLMKSIRKKLYVLPDATQVYPGHGPATTIGEEKLYNPFCAVE
ncbi:MAG: MBL fold metallo-hydrolase [Cyclobacteriaceae bacterium]|nr:MBL fold metallo-hydrolase [Cyclobacteriaceae bacterium]